MFYEFTKPMSKALIEALKTIKGKCQTNSCADCPFSERSECIFQKDGAIPDAWEIKSEPEETVIEKEIKEIGRGKSMFGRSAIFIDGFSKMMSGYNRIISQVLYFKDIMNLMSKSAKDMAIAQTGITEEEINAFENTLCKLDRVYKIAIADAVSENRELIDILGRCGEYEDQ